MQQRIDRLESLLKNLISQGQRIAPPHDTPLPDLEVSIHDRGEPVTSSEAVVVVNDISALPYSAGTTVVNGERSIYNAGNDWADVLHEVSPGHFLFHLSSLCVDSPRVLSVRQLIEELG
jgi:hypothetical protein